MHAWAALHSWKRYVEARDGSHPPYLRSSSSDPEHLAYGSDLVVLPGGCSDQGVVFTTERLIVENLVEALLQAGDKGVAVKSDGTYKISYEGADC